MRLHLIPLVAGLVAATAACGGGSRAASTGDTIKIAALVNQTGPLAQKGVTNNLQMAVDEINAAGGASGRKVELKFYDLGGITPQQGRAAAQKALADTPNALIGPTVSAQTNAFLDLLPAVKVPLINASAQRESDPGQPKGNEWTFRIYHRTDRMAEAISRATAETLKAKNVVVTHSTDDTSTHVKDFVVKDLEAKGVTVRDVVSYAPDATDLTNSALATRGADAVVALGYPQPLALLVKQMRANGIMVPIVFDQGAEAIVRGRLVSGQDLTNTSVLMACAPTVTQNVDPVAKAFVDKFTATYPGSSINGYYYDAVKLIAEGVKNAGSLDPDKLRAGLGAIKGYKGVCGEASADPDQNYIHEYKIVKLDGGEETFGGVISGLTGAY
ncbi:branched-chain amino acid transport system substrate-binding protein [Streptosporangium album]|uniref:Branched-chain amino acid transport system substrate-binding protein n=1 Tax=Streptosporangium album TaxID=47479 RepID=A0A7W7WFA2_9ACTN|nr:ABC transporter substrate-binding protein [Streptosporangium album]MBB4944189.1 branched-chain amino acid transport system substrate-binding protein [Streptosporangium album]